MYQPVNLSDGSVQNKQTNKKKPTDTNKPKQKKTHPKKSF